MTTHEEIRGILRAQELNTERLLSLPNVVGTGTGYRQQKGEFTDEVVVQTFVQQKYPVDHLPDWAIVPREVTGPEGEPIPIDVIEVGFVYAAVDPTRYRPVPGGCSIGHQNSVDASTLGGWACDLADDSVVLLTCNHCIANLSVASVPGGIVQPGRLDGGAVPGDLIGQLKRFVPITTGASCMGLPVTPVDAAIGTITEPRTDEVIDIGPAIYELGAPTLEMAVHKRGRTTEYTNNGVITSVNVQVCVNYGGVLGVIGNAFIVTSTDGAAFANRGDSGSLIFDQSPGELEGTFPVVGMFFAVSNGGITTWHNDINVIFDQLRLTTLCDCAARALIEAISGTSERTERQVVRRDIVREKDLQLRRLRARVLRGTSFGKLAEEYLVPETAHLARVIMEDDEAFGLAVKTLRPWVLQRTNFDILESELDEETVENFGRLADRVAEVHPDLKRKMRTMKLSLAAVKGKQVRQVLRVAELHTEKKRKK
jgi:hypothetical protein